MYWLNYRNLLYNILLVVTNAVLCPYRFVKMVDLMLKFLREIKNESPRKLLDVQMGWYHRLLHMFELIKLRTWNMCSSLFTKYVSIKLFLKKKKVYPRQTAQTWNNTILRTRPFGSWWRLNKNTLTWICPLFLLFGTNILVWEWTWVWDSKNLSHYFNFTPHASL